ncbi:MAG TPA: hypothetical protein VE548_09105, partial [Nitrososphaeraceae archaeon]|nr:hypothetical protein [Nitrososphaeraceae archaeon]
MKIIVFSASLFVGIAVCLLQLQIFYPITASVFSSTQIPLESDNFGIREIYPTKENGREWHMNMENPKEDEHFSITFNPNIARQEDGSWRISTPVVRMNVKTLEGETNWKNVEMTGYAKIAGVIANSSNKVIENDLTWYARGGKHNQEIPCEATAYMGGLYDNGKVGWKKELWFVGGYTDERQ